ncbi:hypothetical protein BIY24_00325 [Halobacteriovorax marinus]|uniref:UDP-N-acetylmuramoyl-tripeptide--D-alanyl-D- alanine ligase n=1 Tax=Halobacteriovorax marinus TaxID=97084 RepID=UPI000BC35AA8|nr:UDP-N-acetylmuramoyl-tripeptide--D-alanyl-D-alanine ligase [Halobacteriovorax marinus]ATH06438.1 hypothetical protein BIY24_00325 [Halobacteriovorax marinus]
MFDLSLLNLVIEEDLFQSSEVELSTDSRTYSGEGLFICLCGENFDGFNFIEPVLEKGCKNIVFRNNDENLERMNALSEKFQDVTFIGVDSPLATLQSLANKRIRQFKNDGGFVFGITGSNGKTTTKEMLASLLSSAYGKEVHATKGNLNNHIGVPLTILSAPTCCKYMIVEMGANHVGEISDLCEIAMPEFGIISSVGAAHIGLFGGIENIFKEKKSLYDYVLRFKTDRSKFIVNNEDKYLSQISPSEVLIKFGDSSDVDVTYDEGKIVINNVNIENVNILEKYNLSNLASAYLLAVNIFPDKKDTFISAASEYRIPSLNRSEWIQRNGKQIFLDAYNANPTSMESSLNSFIENMKKKGIPLDDVLFVLGDMNELGDYAKDEHERIARELDGLGAKNVIFVGNYSKYYMQGLPSGIMFEKKEDLVSRWSELSKECSALFIKASRSLQLESLIDIT